MNQAFFSLVFLLLFPVICNSQVATDSLRCTAERLVNTDILTKEISPLGDSILSAYTKIDSIRNDFNTRSDSLKKQYHKSISNIDAESNQLRQKIDSLQQLKVSTNKYKRSLTKLSNLRKKTEKKFTRKLNWLKTNTIGKLRALKLPTEYSEPLEKLANQIDKLSMNNYIRVPELKIPGYELPDFNDIGKVPSLNEMPDGVEVPKLPGIDTRRELGNISGQVQGFQDQIKDIAPNDITDVQKLPETLESQASRIDGMGELQKKSGVVDEYKSRLEVIKDPKLAKAKAVEEASKVAVDHFAGKQEQLKAAMEKIFEYKQKYSSVSSIKDLPKRPPNPMKGKPFIERLTTGVYFQFQRKNYYLLDVNPYVGYKLSGRFTMGLVGIIGLHGTESTTDGTNDHVYSVHDLLSTSNLGKDL